MKSPAFDAGPPNHKVCQYIRGQSGMALCANRLRGAQIVRRRFAGAAVGNDVVGNLLPLVEGVHAGAFNRADMNEDVLATVLRLNEAEAFLAVKPLYNTRVHLNVLSLRVRTWNLARDTSAPTFRFSILVKRLKRARPW